MNFWSSLRNWLRGQALSAPPARPLAKTELGATPYAILNGVALQEWQAREILAATAQLLGWEPALLWVGYTYDDEGIPIKYNEFLRGPGENVVGFEEFHFAQVGRHP